MVVGGGITGAGVALDAASRGLSVALLERRDLAHGTSRWSSKLVHGGLRYLEHREWGLAWESARERALLMGTIAPHLVRPLPFVIPLTAACRPRRRRKTQVGLRIGDGLRIGARTSRARAAARAADQRARGAPARARAGRGRPARRAAELGRPARGRRAAGRRGRPHRRRARRADPHLRGRDAACATTASTRVDALTGAAFSVRARHVILATGVWAGELAPGRRAAAEPRLAPARRRPGGSATRARRSTCRCRASAGAGCSRCRAPTGWWRSGSPTSPPTGRSPTSRAPSAEEEAQLLAHASAALEVSLGPGGRRGPLRRPAAAAGRRRRRRRPPTSRAATRSSRTRRRAR